MRLQVIKLPEEEAIDLLPGSTLRSTKVVDEVDKINRITQEAALTVDAPVSPRNRRLFANTAVNVLNRSADRFTSSVRVSNEGMHQNLTEARVTGYGAGEGYDVELYADDWQQALELVPLNEIDLGTFLWTQGNIENTWGRDRGDADVLPLMADFGKWFAEGTISIEDLRLCPSLRAVLTAAFAKIGWNFICPHLTDGDGRTWYVYLGSERWHYYPSKIMTGFVELSGAGKSIDGRGNGVVDWAEVRDDDDQWRIPFLYDRKYYLYFPPDRDRFKESRFQVELSATVTVNAVPINSGVSAPALTVRIVETSINPDGSRTEDILAQFDYIIPVQEGTYTQQIEIDHTLVMPRIKGVVEVVFEYRDLPADADATILFEAATLIFRPDPPLYGRGDNVEVAAGLDPDISALEVLTGAAHLVNAKFTTDLARKEVRMDVPFGYTRTNFPDQFIPGFYQHDQPAHDLRAQSAPRSLKWTNTEDKTPRYVVYDFKGSQDEAVTEADRLRLRRRVDTGRGTRSKDQKRENPLFEPTARVRVKAEQTGTGPIELPALWDNTDGRLSFDLAPRILNYYGLAGSIADQGYLLNGQLRLSLPHFSQIEAPPNRTRRVEPLSFSGYANDLYQRFYARELNWREVPIELFLTGGDATYDLIDFRRLLLVATEDGQVEIQPRAVRDHERGSQTPLLIEGYVIL